MTDRYSAFTVILERDIRDDDAEGIIQALKHIRGVADVKPHLANPEEAIAETRVRLELQEKLFDVLYPKSDGGQAR